MDSTALDRVRGADVFERVVAEEEDLEAQGDAEVQQRQEDDDESDGLRIRLGERCDVSMLDHKR